MTRSLATRNETAADQAVFVSLLGLLLLVLLLLAITRPVGVVPI